MGIVYRLQQFLQLITAQPLPACAWRNVESILTPSELELFRRHAPADQKHSYRVLRALQAAGEGDPHLLAASLLHDIGKTQVRPTLWDRVAGAVGERLFPALARNWGVAEYSRWRRPFIIRRQHAVWGAEMARQAGSHPSTLLLIRRHQDPAQSIADQHLRDLLQRLQAADSRN